MADDRYLLLEELRRRLLAAERAGNTKAAISLRKQLSVLADRATVEQPAKR